MRIKIASDIHLEFSDYTIENDEKCDVLLLPGDILIAQDLHDHPVVSEFQAQMGSRQARALRYRKFLSTCSNLFDDVIYVSGNHELYSGRWYAGIDYIREECAKYSNIHFFEDDTLTIDDIVFVGGALWTDMNKQDPLTLLEIRNAMSDFSVIRNDKRTFKALKPAETVTRHKKTKAYIQQVLEDNADKQCVVVTHHAPSELSCAELYKNDTTTNGGFYSDLNDFILDHPQIKLWAHGHTHTAFDYELGDTRVICNPRGYVTEMNVENPDWSENKIIEL